MARYPGAQQATTVNQNTGEVNRPPKGIVMHTAVGSYEGTIGWQEDPASQVSSHFIVAQDGRVTQMVDTNDRAWAESEGNPDWISIEHEGDPTQALTPAQIVADVGIYLWLVETYPGFPVQLTDSVDIGGLGWHGMGGAAWGGHFECPGDLIKAQRQQIVDAVNAALHPAQPPVDAWKQSRLHELLVWVDTVTKEPLVAGVQSWAVTALKECLNHIGEGPGNDTVLYGPKLVDCVKLFKVKHNVGNDDGTRFGGTAAQALFKLL